MLAFAGDQALAIPTKALFMNAAPHPSLKSWPSILGWQPFKPLATAWENAGFTRIDELTSEKWPLVMILPGKSKAETLAHFAMARERLEPGGRLLVSMPNTAGAGRFEKEFARAAGNIVSIQKHKCRAFLATLDEPNDDLFAQWKIFNEPREILGFLVLPGIFSSDHIDPGSQLLADHLPAFLHGNIADLGAGWGFLSDAVLKRCPRVQHLSLFEADARALDCARKNLAHHPNEVSYHWHDVTQGLPTTYDAIIMNPPFHTGQATDIDLGRNFLKVAISSLKRDGKLLLVANRTLPYEAVLETSGLAWRKIAENRTYKILFADKR